MKTVLFSFMLFTATLCFIVATLAFLGVLKARKDKGKTDDDIATGIFASAICWSFGLLFLYAAYLAS